MANVPLSSNDPSAPQPKTTSLETAEAFEQTHVYTDVDGSPNSQHHTLGREPTQAAAGDHNHDGKDSPLIPASNIQGLAAVMQTNPVGAIIMYAGAADPVGGQWLICDGRAISRADYASLLQVIGVAYGPGDSSSTFNIPDLRSRTPIGVGQGPGLSQRNLGTKVGEEAHQLLNAEMPSHQHYFNVSGYTGGSGDHVHNAYTDTYQGDYDFSVGERNIYAYLASGNFAMVRTGYRYWAAHAHRVTTDPPGNHSHAMSASGTSDYSGSGLAHNVMQPSLGVNFIIKVK